MKINFYVFSGSGNTLKVSSFLSNLMKEKGVETKLIRINKDTKVEEDVDKIIVSYPVHAFNAPTPIIKFLKSLSHNDKKIPIYFIQTSGEPLKMNFAAFSRITKIAKRKGYDVRGQFSYVMPYNIIFHHKNSMASRMWNVVKIRGPKEVELIINSEKHFEHINIFQKFISFVLRIEHVAMPVIGKTFKVKKDKCVLCGACTKICPRCNIVIEEGKVKFRGNCVGCMGCAFHCPKDAIRTSILNGWRVNGKYNFDLAPASDEEICKYCHKAYLRYFHQYEQNDKNSNIL